MSYSLTVLLCELDYTFYCMEQIITDNVIIRAM